MGPAARSASIPFYREKTQQSSPSLATIVTPPATCVEVPRLRTALSATCPNCSKTTNVSTRALMAIIKAKLTIVNVRLFVTVACELSCGTCSGGLRNQCLTCGTESYYKLFVAALSECHVICPEGYYEATSTTCSACDSTCSECVTNSASECFTCPTGRFLYDHQCVTSCPTGTTANNGVCTSNCPSGQFTTTAGTADCSGMFLSHS